MTSASSLDILARAAEIQAERARVYGAPNGERSMTAIVAAFNAITGHALAEADGWLFLIILKLVREQACPGHQDSVLDAVSYAALWGEAASDHKRRGV